MKILVYIFLLVNVIVQAQERYLTKTGTVNFEASVPSFEEVAAKNNSVTAIFKPETNEFAALVLIKGFRFKNALMEEHFNENYAESNQYPKSTFTGKIEKLNVVETKNTEGYTITGALTFHGVTKAIENIPIKVIFDNETITMQGDFTVNASDFNIDIPNIVKSKVSEKVNVSFKFKLIKN